MKVKIENMNFEIGLEKENKKETIKMEKQLVKTAVGVVAGFGAGHILGCAVAHVVDTRYLNVFGKVAVYAGKIAMAGALGNVVQKSVDEMVDGVYGFVGEIEATKKELEQ